MIKGEQEKEEHVACSSSCGKCEQSPCVWEGHKQKVKKLVRQMRRSSIGANEKRKMCYQFVTREMQGTLGRGVRIRLPGCVVGKIRFMLPDARSDYMGFKES